MASRVMRQAQRECVQRFLASRGCKTGKMSITERGKMAASILGIEMEDGKRLRFYMPRIIKAIARAAPGAYEPSDWMLQAVKRPKPPGTVPRQKKRKWIPPASMPIEPPAVIAFDAPQVKAFYASWEWKRLRYDVIQERGRKCECCNRTAQDHGIVINVDHIKPIRYHWHLRLVQSNLQVLCDDCNMGKGSRDETDWRKSEDAPAPAVLPWEDGNLIPFTPRQAKDRL